MGECEKCRYKSVPRDESLKKQLKNRMNRIIGQLNGMTAMLDDERYCGDILIQLAAAEKALQSVGYLILRDHIDTCVAQQFRDGEPQAAEELLGLIERLK
jgi:DNA-binding FrmR family transcriptional regulator